MLGLLGLHAIIYPLNQYGMSVPVNPAYSGHLGKGRVFINLEMDDRRTDLALSSIFLTFIDSMRIISGLLPTT